LWALKPVKPSMAPRVPMSSMHLVAMIWFVV
jgi:hypothetical protein